MENQKFKTNLKCGGCVAAVKNNLDELENIESWDVDLASPDKILTVKGNANVNEIEEAFVKAGYKAELAK